MTKTEFTLSCGRGKCCPKVRVLTEGAIIVQDDYRGLVILTKDQIRALYKEIES